MSRKKTHQKRFFEGVDTLPPLLTQQRQKRAAPVDSSENDSSKRQRLESSFAQSIKDRLKAMVLSEMKKKKPDLVKLKDNLLNKRTLPPGAVLDAAKLASCDLYEMKKYLDHRYVRANQQESKEAVSEYFDGYVESSSSPSTETSSTSTSTPHTEPPVEDEQYSVFTVPIHSFSVTFFIIPLRHDGIYISCKK